MTMSSSEMVLLFTASMAMSKVIILVIDAGGQRRCSFCAKKTVPLSRSIRIAARYGASGEKPDAALLALTAAMATVRPAREKTTTRRSTRRPSTHGCRSDHGREDIILHPRNTLRMNHAEAKAKSPAGLELCVRLR